jgi:hypothetical protein
MNVRACARRRFAAAAAAFCTACCVACDDGLSGARDVEIEIDSSLTIWANLMPTFPSPPDPIHALVPVEFRNLSDAAVVVDAVKVVVRSVAHGRVLHAFRLEPVTDWHGYLPPGGSASGEWRKTASLFSGRLVCDEQVAGTLWITATPEDGSRIVALPVTLDPTTLACVY